MLRTVRRKSRNGTDREILWHKQRFTAITTVSMLGTVRRKAGINEQGNLMVPAVSQHVWNGEKEAGINVHGNLMVPAVSQHVWNGEKEMQERTEGPYGP